MSRRARWWSIYALGVAGAIVALAWLTRFTLDLEARRAEAAHQSALRLALWRMESWLAPRLAQESGRPYFEWLPYYAPSRAYDRMFRALAAQEILTPSPLLVADVPMFPLHFQVHDDGRIESPQVPEGNLRDLAEGTIADPERIRAKAALLASIAPAFRPAALVEACSIPSDDAGTFPFASIQLDDPAVAPRQSDPAWQKKALAAEQSRRAQNLKEFQQAQQAEQSYGPRQTGMMQVDLGDETEKVEVGAFAATWLESSSSSEPALVLLRRVRGPSVACVQGILVDWPALRTALLAEIADLFPSAELGRTDGDPTPTDAPALSSLPVALLVAPIDPATIDLSGVRRPLAFVWIASLAALALGAGAVQAAMQFAERRARFASSVTHELRTPLTTFRMYTEMLDEGLVRDETKRREYVHVLRRESDRLAALVENVLAYARLERGALEVRREPWTIDALLAEVRPTLEARCRAADMTLDVVVAPGAGAAEVGVDLDSIRRILVNLVDNACKYAAGADDRRVHLAAAREADATTIAVRDHGPGVPRTLRRLFTAFERGPNGANGTPGLGLGLALARGLARRLGGDLVHETPVGGGAGFVLRLPHASNAA